MLRHLRSRALQFFQTRFIEEVKRATKAEFKASIDSIIKDTMDKFEKESRDISISKEWDASAARENVFSEIETMTAEAKTKIIKVSNTLTAKLLKGLTLGIGGAGAVAGAVVEAAAKAAAGPRAGEIFDNSDTANDLEGEIADDLADSLDWVDSIIDLVLNIFG
ncbi:hypothetical protein OIU84_001331 [Salix udensis]|uniref:Sey1/RHD3-like three-helix bundle domain-containing protein n=1 Tax=Salix udensis TaxID=889485 RepID=A0AAD6K6T3_9ROSI|nr:hypothetical protein OIU84_001331 [Salix udensis]